MRAYSCDCCSTMNPDQSASNGLREKRRLIKHHATGGRWNRFSFKKALVVCCNLEFCARMISTSYQYHNSLLGIPFDHFNQPGFHWAWDHGQLFLLVGQILCGCVFQKNNFFSWKGDYLLPESLKKTWTQKKTGDFSLKNTKTIHKITIISSDLTISMGILSVRDQQF